MRIVFWYGKKLLFVVVGTNMRPELDGCKIVQPTDSKIQSFVLKDNFRMFTVSKILTAL